MRLWTLHPKYLDRSGLLACWREGLLALNVLLGNTKGYKKHPQLCRFLSCKKSISAISYYLFEIYREADRRGYYFAVNKIPSFDAVFLYVNSGQVEYETKHLQKKLLSRDFKKCLKLSEDKLRNKIEVHPMFVVQPGPQEYWEK